MPRVLRALEFYSGIGGLHYASVLFNHLAKHRDLYNREFSPETTKENKTTDELHAVLFPHPETTWCKSGTSTDVANDETLTYTEQKALNTSSQSPTLTLPFIHVVESFEINSLANDVYEFNFGRRPHEALIDRLTPTQADSYKADIFLMSPPCQPYTRGGLQRDENDARASSFHHLLLTVIPNMSHQPKYILLENVQCFESSQSCSFALAQLRSLGYKCEQFLLSPRQFGIPNQRSRFFLLATKRDSDATTTSPSLPPTSTDDIISFHIPHNIHFKSKKHANKDELLAWSTPDQTFSRILCVLPPSGKDGEKLSLDILENVSERTSDITVKEPILIPTKAQEESHIPTVFPSHLSPFLVDTSDLSGLSKKQSQNYEIRGEDTTNFSIASVNILSTQGDEKKNGSSLLLPPSLLSKPSAWCVDIADPVSRSVTCFTKAYTTFIRGAGSVLQTLPQKESLDVVPVHNELSTTLSTLSPELLIPLSERGLRYFDPREVANLHFFPPAYIEVKGNQQDKTIEDNFSPKHEAHESLTKKLKLSQPDNNRQSESSKKKKLTKAERVAIRLAQSGKPNTTNFNTHLSKSPIAHGNKYMCFSFPSHITFRQRHRMLGNSLNVYVVSQLLTHMLQPEFDQ